MPNWETSTAAPNYEQHNAWYSSMFAANIKQEPMSHHHNHHHQQHDNTSNSNSNSGASSPRQSPLPSPNAPSTQLEQYLKQQQQQQQPMDTMCAAAMTPSPSNNDQNSIQHFDTTLQQQLLQQQQYQQHFQAAQHQQQQHHHLTLGGFNPLTPPGLPNPMQHYYASNMRPSPQPTPTAVPTAVTAAIQTGDKLQALTPPMDVTPPKSPAKSQQSSVEPEKDHDLMSNSSEDMKYMAESEDDDSNIRMPIYNSHGKMKNYKCKTCGIVAITKVDFWAHTRTHMKPDKILQCSKCPFVTEFKHHLEYHIRKHKNQKPFQCDKCSYTCVNKSMLNSHRKSHSSVYQYRCADCDYATKYCHSFKLHLRKYGHKPGMVLDEDGTPNPSLVIDVYGTRRGPKSKSFSGSSSNCGASSKRSNASAASQHQHQQQQPQHQPQQQQQPVLPPSATSQLSAALQGFPIPAAATATAAPAAVAPVSPPSPAKSVASVEQAPSLSSALLPPLASLLQQNRNMAFFPYWNLNLQMLAAQQQAAVLAQLSPRMRDQLQQQQQQQHHNQQQQQQQLPAHSDNEEEEHDDDFERKSVDSAMDLSQGTPVKEEPQQQHQTQSNHMAINLKLKDDDTPLISSSTASRRKGRVLKLDTLLQLKSAAMSSPEQQLKLPPSVLPTASSPIAGSSANKQLADDPCSGASSADESMETSRVPQANTSASSTASSSGNSSNASTNSNPVPAATVATSATVSSSSTSTSASSSAPAIYECKYCDIYFKDAVLYTIHMGYHSCDDVFKCNMCGEKCDGPVGLFVHMARNAHS